METNRIKCKLIPHLALGILWVRAPLMLDVPMQTLMTIVLVHLVVVAQEVLAALRLVLVIDQVGGIVEQWTGILVAIAQRPCRVHAVLLLRVVMQAWSTTSHHSHTCETLHVLIT